MSNLTLKKIAQTDDGGVKQFDIYRIDPDKIKFQDGFNLRLETPEQQAQVEKFYLAMKAGAIFPPLDLSVIEGEVYCTDGHTRTLAGQKYKKEFPEFTLQAREFRGNEVDRVLHMLGTGTGGKSLTPLEAGIGFFRLTKAGLKPNEIAERLGITAVTVREGIKLAEADPEIQKLVQAGTVSATTAQQALRKGKEGVETLKAKAAEKKKELDETPEDGGGGKKKPASRKAGKVTGKSLEDTPAAKGKRKKKSAQPEIEIMGQTDLQEETLFLGDQLEEKSEISPAKAAEDPNNINIFVDREVAQATATFLRKGNLKDPKLKAMTVALESALL